MSAIEVQQLGKRFSDDARAVIADLSFTVSAQESLCLLGPSGCGKTTLLRLLMGLELPSSGTVKVAPELSEHMSYVFQEPRLVPWRTCLENVLLPLELLGRGSDAANAEVLDLLQQLGLQDLSIGRQDKRNRLQGSKCIMNLRTINSFRLKNGDTMMKLHFFYGIHMVMVAPARAIRLRQHTSNNMLGFQ